MKPWFRYTILGFVIMAVIAIVMIKAGEERSGTEPVGETLQTTGDVHITEEVLSQTSIAKVQNPASLPRMLELGSTG